MTKFGGSDAGIDGLLSRVADLMASAGAKPVNVMRIDEFSKEGGECAILHFTKPEAEERAREANLDMGLVFPITLKVVREGDGYRLEADRFYQKAGELENADPERVQRLIHEVDEMVDRVVKQA